MKIKGWELMKKIADGEIKKGDKIKDNFSTYIFNGGNFVSDEYRLFFNK